LFTGITLRKLFDGFCDGGHRLDWPISRLDLLQNAAGRTLVPHVGGAA
jgi:hypothetical protein